MCWALGAHAIRNVPRGVPPSGYGRTHRSPRDSGAETWETSPVGVENVGSSRTRRWGGGRARHPDIRHGQVVSGFAVPHYRTPSRRAMLPRSPLDPPVVPDSDGTGGR